ncbi:hypothetical protein TNCV_2348491 [Trichonephila clavipes]|uniref:Uncharacterized protein n=1 Tax=Trichonephila clavipes TaxID=2585209 RepID=A0A8X6VKI1_TRICX|nr:hypothetical protein TNCV_2348491 [Trichonephila clavipes]
MSKLKRSPIGGVEVTCRLLCRLRQLTMIQNYLVRRQKPSIHRIVLTPSQRVISTQLTSSEIVSMGNPSFSCRSSVV